MGAVVRGEFSEGLFGGGSFLWAVFQRGVYTEVNLQTINILHVTNKLVIALLLRSLRSNCSSFLIFFNHLCQDLMPFLTKGNRNQKEVAMLSGSYLVDLRKQIYYTA